MTIIATRDLKKGEELTVAFVDVTQRPDESAVDCRRRRRMELARGWRFACGCERCSEESRPITSEDGLSEEQQKDDSRVEDVVKNYSAGSPEDSKLEGSGVAEWGSEVVIIDP